jgi:hypothetical protein
MCQVPAEKPSRFLVGEDAAVGDEGRHDSGITVHPAKLVEMFGAKALGDQAVGGECFQATRAFYL